MGLLTPKLCEKEGNAMHTTTPASPQRRDAMDAALAQTEMPLHPLLMHQDTLMHDIRRQLHLEWQARAMNNADTDPLFRHDAQVVLNRARGFGLLSELIPPVRDDLARVAFNSDGSLWLCHKSDMRWRPHPGTWTPDEVSEVVNECLLFHSDAKMTEETPAVSRQACAIRTDDGARLGSRPHMDVTAMHASVNSGRHHSFVLNLCDAQTTTPDRVREWGVMPNFLLDQLLRWVEDGRNVLISGPLGSGRTSLMHALAHHSPDRGGLLDDLHSGQDVLNMFRTFTMPFGIATLTASSPRHAVALMDIRVRTDTDVVATAAVPQLLYDTVDIIIQTAWADVDGSRVRCVECIVEPLDRACAGSAPLAPLHSGEGDSGIHLHNLWHRERSPNTVRTPLRTQPGGATC